MREIRYGIRSDYFRTGVTEVLARFEHLVHETIIIAGIVARVDVFEALPMLDKDLFEDIGGLASLCQHQSAPSEGMGLEGMERFYHVSHSESTPHRFSPCLLTPSLALETRGVQGGSKMHFPIRSR